MHSFSPLPAAEAASATMNTTREEDDFDPFAAGAIEQTSPATEAQREVWLADQLGEQASLAYNESLTLRLRGALDTPALVTAFDALVARHPALRATFSSDGSQLLIGEPAPLQLAEHDLRALAPAQQKRALEAEYAAIVRERFDLSNGPLFRAALYHLAPMEYLLVMSAHHAVCDGWSWGVIADDLGRLYAERIGAGPALDPAPGYPAYAAWEAAEAESPDMQAHIAYWLGKYDGTSLPVLELPLDRARPAVRTFASQRIDHALERPLIDALRRTGAGAGASLYAVLFSGFAALLHRLTAQDDIVVGIAAAGQMAANMPRLVGHCVNLLPLRVAVDDTLAFDALMRSSGSQLLDAFEHQGLTYGSLLRRLPMTRDASRLPLVSVLFNVDRDAAPNAGSFPGIEAEQGSLPRACENFELFVNIAPTATGMQVELQYNSDLFDRATIARWLDAYECLLRSAVADPARRVGRLDLLDAAGLDALRSLQPAPWPPLEAALQTMHAAFAAQAQAEPARHALRFEGLSLSYGELDAQSNRLARALRARGIGRGALVGLCLPRDAGMVMALLAVLKTGAAYVPLDPDFPPARLDYYAQDASLALLLTLSDVATAPRAWHPEAAARTLALDTERAWLDESDAALAPGALDARPGDVAYVIYTSGSTGKPKGVAVPHGAVANFLRSMRHEPGIDRNDRLVAVTTLSFDIAVLELMLPLSVGAEVIIATREVAMNGTALGELIHASGATMLQATPGMWRLLLEAGWQRRVPFKALVGGESLPGDLAHALLHAAGEVWNMYGPTETTIWSTLWRVDPALVGRTGVSIGRPIANTTVWILDEHLQPLPPGVPGERCIGGDGLATGYLHRPDLTADRFVTLDLGDGRPTRIYRTGDRGRWRSDGLLAHLGRNDFQVKVRGYRIELGEIESRCNELPGVTSSVVLAREDKPGDVRLVAYLATVAGAAIDRGALGEHLRKSLPQYMLPQHVVTLAALPLLPNGKVDRKALPAPTATPHSAAAAPARIAPRNDRERTVLGLMEEVLHTPGLGVVDDFFAMGGHSLLAARLAVRIGTAFGLQLPLGKVFEAPTAERMAAEIARIQASGTQLQIAIPRRADRHVAPLTLEQQRMRFAEELHPGTTAFNTPSVHRLTGPLDRALFERALRLVVRRQDALRTAVVPALNAEGWHQRIDDAVAFELPFEDLGALDAPTREAEMRRRAQAVIDTPIATGAAPLFRCALYRLGAQEHVFLFMAHHLVWDGYSFDVLYREMAALYGALVAGGDAEAALPETTVSYGDFAAWQARWLEGADAERQRAHWRARLAAAPVLTMLAPDTPARPGTPGEGRSEHLSVPGELSEALRDMARRHNLTLNMVLMAAYGTALAHAIGQPAVGIGMPVRGRIVPELEDVMGFFVGLVPVLLEARPELSFADFAAALRTEVTGALAHQDLPFQHLTQQAGTAQRRAGLYQAVFSFQDTRERQRHWGPLAHDMVMMFQKGLTDDLGLWLLDRPTGLEGFFVYNASLYTAATAAAFRQSFLDILAAVAASPATRLGDLARPAAVLAQAAATHAAAPAPATGAPALLQPEQARLAQLWASALDIDVNEIRPDDNFFDLGGDSLMAMRVVQNSQQVLGHRVEPRRYVFESLAQLATRPAASATVPGALDAAEAPAPARVGLLGRMFQGWGRKG